MSGRAWINERRSVTRPGIVCYDSREPAGPAVDSMSRQLSLLIHDSLARSSGLVPAAYIGAGQGYFARDDLTGLNLRDRAGDVPRDRQHEQPGRGGAPSSDSGRRRIARAVAAGILAYLKR